MRGRTHPLRLERPRAAPFCGALDFRPRRESALARPGETELRAGERPATEGRKRAPSTAAVSLASAACEKRSSEAEVTVSSSPTLGCTSAVSRGAARRRRPRRAARRRRWCAPRPEARQRTPPAPRLGQPRVISCHLGCSVVEEGLPRQRVHRLHPLQRRRVRLCRQHVQRHLRLGEVSGSSRRHTRVARPWPRRRPRAARPAGGSERGQVGHILAHRPQSAVGRRQHQAAVGQQDPRPLARGGPAALAAPVRRRLGQSVLAPRCAARRSAAREAGALTAAPSSDDALGQASARRRLPLAEDAAAQQVWRGRRQRRT